MEMQNQIVNTIKEVDNGKKRVSGTITTEKGTPLYWEVYMTKVAITHSPVNLNHVAWKPAFSVNAAKLPVFQI